MRNIDDKTISPRESDLPGHVQPWIGLMRSMKTPQKGNATIQAMPKLHPGIEEEKCSEKMRPARER
jgi:hypothetical protein